MSTALAMQDIGAYIGEPASFASNGQLKVCDWIIAMQRKHGRICIDWACMHAWLQDYGCITSREVRETLRVFDLGHSHFWLETLKMQGVLFRGCNERGMHFCSTVPTGGITQELSRIYESIDYVMEHLADLGPCETAKELGSLSSVAQIGGTMRTHYIGGGIKRS